MTDYVYLDGAKYLPSDDEVKKLRADRLTPASAPSDRSSACRSLQLLTGPRRRLVALSRRGRAVADLRRDADRQLRARLVLHAGPLRRGRAGRRLGAPAPLGFWPRVLLAALAVAALGALIEILLLRRIYARARAVPAARDLRAGPRHPATPRCWLWGPEDLLGPSAPGAARRVTILGRRSRATTCSRSRRPARARRALAAADAHALGHCWCAPRRRTARWSARSASTSAGSSPRVFALGTFLAGARRRAAVAARAGQPQHRPRADRRGLRRRRGRRHGLDPAAPSSPRC